MAGNTIANLLVRLGLDSKDYQSGLDAATNRTNAFKDKALSGMTKIGGGLIGVMAGLAGGIGLLGVKTGMTAAEVKQMRMVTQVMGDTAGYTADQILKQRNALVDSGITYGGTEQVLQGLIAAQLEVGNATDLSRMAQNLAVKTGEDSTQTTLRLMRAIELGSTELAKGAGLTLSFADAQKAYADELGKSVDELTTAEEMQANFNAVMEKGAPFMGLYEEAMEHPIKQLGSLKRLFDTLSVEIGKYFVPALSDVIAGFSDFVKGAIDATSEGGTLEPLLRGLGDVFSWLGDIVSRAFVWMGEGIPVFIEKLQSAWDWLQDNKGVLIGILAALGAAIGVFVYTVILPAVGSVLAAIAPALLVMAAVGAVAYLMYEAWSNNWLGIKDIFTELWNWLSVNIPLAIETLKIFWTETLLPAIQAVWLWVQEVAFPIIQTLWNWLSVGIATAITVLSGYWNNVLLPAIRLVWSFITGSLLPIFKTIATFIGGVFSVVLSALASIWENVLKPAIEAVWNFLKTNVFPIFQALGEFLGAVFSLVITALAGLWENVLQPAIEKVWEWVRNKIMPIFKTLKDFWDNKFGPIIEKIAGWLSDKLQPAFAGIAVAVEVVVGWIKSLTKMLKNIKLPDWLTPGSPTPFEMGLVGIGKQLDVLSRKSLPRFSAELDVDNALMSIGDLSNGSQGMSTENNFYITSPLKEDEALTPTQEIKRLSMLYGVS